MVWLRCAKHLQKDFRVIIPDLAGHGRTTFIESAGYSVPKQTERLHYFLHQLGIHESVTIAGNSMGGFIAAQFALDYPNAVNKIICVNPAGAMTDMLSPTQQMIQAGNNPFLMEDVRDFPQFYQLTMAKPPYFPGFLKTGIAHLYVEKKAQYEEIFNDFSNPEDLLNTRLTGIQCQVLMLWGGLDQIIHLSCAEVWRAHTDNITVIWEDLGHMPMLESPRLCALEIQRFLNGQLTT
jgi:pimeloyl-ACP methyl ester carboxylesterase